MLFSSLEFLCFFFPVFFLVYFLVSRLCKKAVWPRNAVLLVFSLVFYAWGELSYFWLLMLSIGINYVFALLIGRCKPGPNTKGSRAGAKALLASDVAVNLALLGVFKYAGLAVTTLNTICGTAFTVPEIALPIGISFFTFQIMSYVIDVYRDKVAPQKNIFIVAVYLCAFPQLIAGPIVRYSVVEQEIDNRSVNATDLCEGALRVILGLAKKVIIANNLWSIVNTFFGKDITGLSVLGTWYTIIVYSLYVYFDFSGYSDIAIGLGRMFGFHFDENFRHPFACTTIAEFWQRWHISLGSFFRDYLLYVPFFGKPRKYFGLFLVWFCTGLWHGAAWNFILWGLYYGCFMLFEQKMGKKRMKKWPIVWKHVYTKLVIILGFGIFYFEDLGQLGQFFLNITGISMIANSAPFTDPMTFSSLRNNIFLILFAILVSLPVLPKIKSYFLESKNDTVYAIGRVGSVAVCMVLLAVVSVLLVDTTNNVFLYFRF